jgi:hypothetical protein
MIGNSKKPKTPFNKKTDKTTSPAKKKNKKPVKRNPEIGDDAVKEIGQLKLDVEAKAKDKLVRDTVTVFSAI